MLTQNNHIATIAGVRLCTLDRTTEVPPAPDTLQIESVVRGSIASLRGLRAGDIILAANQQPVHSEFDLMRIAESADQVLLLDIQRGKGRVLISI